MLWIHGGGFQMGSGDSDMYSPEYLIKENVVIVTCNYRLGPLGFLYLPKAGIYGNAGLYDQLLVMKWVKENIATFSGDPNNVTLFGESAGGSSVHFHALSPISRKYFHKAICQSGLATMDWVMQVNPEEKARALAKSVGFKGESDIEALEELMNCDPDKLIDSANAGLTEDEKRRGLPMAFKPVVDIYSVN